MENINQDLLFLQEKIGEIRIAHFRAETDSVLRLPNNIISTLKVEDGCIWFFTSCTGPYVRHLDRELFVTLEYYKRETNCRLIINGKAFIEEDHGVEGSDRPDKIVLVKVKILKADYYGLQQPTFSFREKIKSAFHHLMAVSPHKMYDFS